jgi:uncharacterized protein YihD (DUF1040 family)
MRDPNRIHEILRVMSKVWYNHPDLRLGQLILNACATDSGLYYMEDEDLLKGLKHAYKEE